MATKAKVPCDSCAKYPLTKDEIGASKKMLGRNTKQLYCLDCLSAYLEITPDQLIDKIAEFKEEGCALFS